MKRKLSLIAIVSLVYANEIDIGEIDVNKPMYEVNGGGIQNIQVLKNIISVIQSQIKE